MTVDETTPPLKQRSLMIRRYWDKIAGVFAVIGLIDVTSQLVKWAAAIHWIVDKYAAFRVWLFGWLPFHVPPEWHNFILLMCVLFSVTNVGFYQQKGRTYIEYMLMMIVCLVAFMAVGLGAVFFDQLKPVEQKIGMFAKRQLNLRDTKSLENELLFYLSHLGSIVTLLRFGDFRLGGYDFARTLAFDFFLYLLAFQLIYGALFAWRWIVATAAAFGVVLGVNFVYVHWLAGLST